MILSDLQLRFQGHDIIQRQIIQKWYKIQLYTVSRKIGATDFFVVTFTNIDGFSQFLVHNFIRECKVIGVKISCHTFVMLLPYRVKVSDKKVTHFTQY